MPRRAVRVLAATAVLGVTLAAQAAPSNAGSTSVPDPRGDVVAYDPADDAGDVQAAPWAAVTDVLRTSVDYRRRYLVVTVRAREAGHRVLRTVQVRDQDTGRIHTFAHRGPSGSIGTRAFGCPGASTSVRKDTATYGFRVPVRCFDAPSRVRVGVALSTRSSADGHHTTDDARSGDHDPAQPYFALGPVLRRG